VSYTQKLPALGSSGNGLRFLKETWSATKDQLTLNLEGAAGRTYELSLWNGEQVASAEGAETGKTKDGKLCLRVTFPAGDAKSYLTKTISLHFVPKSGTKKSNRR
jgi:hypothetical protein